MIDSKKLISTQIEKEIPQFIRMDYPNFVAFIKSYYEWMEKQGAPYQFIANTMNFADVDRTSLELLDTFGKNFLQPLPDVIYDQNNIATLVKYIEQYYSARGSEKAFQFLFRLFEYKDDADHELEFYYPSYDMLRISDGKWVNERSLKIRNPPEYVMEWESGELRGDLSGAIAVIDEIKLYETSSGISIAELFLLEFDVMHTPEKFMCGEPLTVETINEQVYTSSTRREPEDIYIEFFPENVFYGIEITKRSKYNIPDQRVKLLNTGEGEDASVVVDQTGKGVVTSFTIIHGGEDYQVGEKVYTEGDTFGSGAYGVISAVGVNNTITKIDLIFEGHDYTCCQAVKVNSLYGKRAVLMIETDDIGYLKTVEMRNFGVGYLAEDTTLEFNTSMRIYDIYRDGFIGEHIVGQTSGATGVVEFWKQETGVISVNILSGEFVAGEQFIGINGGGSAYIYDMAKAEGVMVDGCICRYKGRYLNMDGHISSLKYIQDSYFYQMFSYMLKTEQDKSEWKDYVKHVHPAGTIGFSYRDVVSQYFRESYGGFICPHLETTEFYKFRWQPMQYHGGHVRYEGNTQIKQYKDLVIDDISNININKLDKTGYCFGSEINIG
ncbi:MAG: hypothetical protein DRQ78_08200 [Epsilonproteobacteria bacterium]|nr:MAG: hypothetical protein DRQ78_08200 [Campylobacterota bacterium]